MPGMLCRVIILFLLSFWYVDAYGGDPLLIKDQYGAPKIVESEKEEQNKLVDESSKSTADDVILRKDKRGVMTITAPPSKPLDSSQDKAEQTDAKSERVHLWVDRKGIAHITETESVDARKKVETFETGTRNKSNPAYINPLASISITDAAHDCKAELDKRYPDKYILQQKLLDANMAAFEELRIVKLDRISTGILKDLNRKHYPAFSVILHLYQNEMRAYRQLQEE